MTDERQELEREGWRAEWGGIDTTADWLRATLEPPKPTLRCIYHTKLVIRGSLTPTGARYVAGPQEIISVEPDDYAALLQMTGKPTGCRGCHGQGNQPARHYFEEV